MAKQIENANNEGVVIVNEQVKATRKSKVSKIDLETENFDEEETTGQKERAPRVSKFDKVRERITSFYKVEDSKFLMYVLNHKPKKQTNNQFAEALVKQMFFDETIIEKIKNS